MDVEAAVGGDGAWHDCSVRFCRTLGLGMASIPDNFPSVPPEQQWQLTRGQGFLEAVFDSDAQHVASVRTEMESFGAESGFDAPSTDEIGLTVNEAIANIIRHAYGSVPGRPIWLRAQMHEGEMEIQLRDWGNGKRPAAPGQKPPDPMKPGGLGLVCMHRMMDQVLFIPQTDGMLLIMRRKLKRP